jgi:hypothetical protein
MNARVVEVYQFLDRHQLWPSPMAERRAEHFRVRAAIDQARTALTAAERAERRAEQEYRRRVAAAVLAGQPITQQAATLRQAADARADATVLLVALGELSVDACRRYEVAFDSLLWAPIVRAVRATGDPVADDVATIIVWQLENSGWQAGEPKYSAAW